VLKLGLTVVLCQFAGTLSAIGGALGLYVGFCGVTFFEIFELLVLLLLALLGWNFKVEDGDEQVRQEDRGANEKSRLNQKPGRKVAPAMDSFLSVSQLQAGMKTQWKEDPGVFVPSGSDDMIHMH
jgi:hypothetical protein